MFPCQSYAGGKRSEGMMERLITDNSNPVDTVHSWFFLRILARGHFGNSLKRPKRVGERLKF